MVVEEGPSTSAESLQSKTPLYRPTKCLIHLLHRFQVTTSPLCPALPRPIPSHPVPTPINQFGDPVAPGTTSPLRTRPPFDIVSRTSDYFILLSSTGWPSGLDLGEIGALCIGRCGCFGWFGVGIGVGGECADYGRESWIKWDK